MNQYSSLCDQNGEYFYRKTSDFGNQNRKFDITFIKLLAPTIDKGRSNEYTRVKKRAKS